MHPYLTEQLAKERRVDLLREAAAWRAAHRGGRRGGCRLRATRRAGPPPSATASLQTSARRWEPGEPNAC
jgi:hypothetical protein